MTAYEKSLVNHSLQLSGEMTEENVISHAGNVAAMIYHDYVGNQNPMAIDAIRKYQIREMQDYLYAGLKIIKDHIKNK